jgi:hypothetical protein
VNTFEQTLESMMGDAEPWHTPFADSLRDWNDHLWASQICVEQVPEHLRMLGLRGHPTESEIRRAFRQKAFVAHPDRGGSQQEFVRLTQALEDALSDLALS